MYHEYIYTGDYYKKHSASNIYCQYDIKYSAINILTDQYRGLRVVDACVINMYVLAEMTATSQRIDELLKLHADSNGCLAKNAYWLP